MYQFNGGPGGNFPYPQQPQPGGYSYGQFPQAQQNQAYSQPHNLPMQQQQYQAPPQIAQAPVSQYSGFPPAQQNQTHAFDGYRPQPQQQPPAHSGSYTGNQPFTSEQPGAQVFNPTAMIPQQIAQFGPPATTTNNLHPRAPQRQVSLGRAKSFPNRLSESCYNCGAPDHWAQDCPEPRRTVPAGQTNRPFKRQKIHGVDMSTDTQGTQQQPPNPQRGGWTDPTAAQRSISMPSNGTSGQATTFSAQRPWAHKQYQKSRMSSASSDGLAIHAWTQQQPHQTSFIPQSVGPSHWNSWNQQNPQRVSQNVASLYHQPWSGHQQHQAFLSASPANIPDDRSWNLQQPGLSHETGATTRFGIQTAATSHNAQADGTSISQAAQWSAQNIPTPAPSSADSQVPSPATSNLNSTDHCAQQTPRYTVSPRNRHDSLRSVQKRNQDPRTQQAEMVACLFSAAAQTPASKSNSPEKTTLVDEHAEDLDAELEELYSLDFPDFICEKNVTVPNPPLLVVEPLSVTHDFDAENQPKVVKDTSTGASMPNYIRSVREEDFFKNIQESSDWNILKDDPVFAKIKANTTTVTFHELIERRCDLVRSFTGATEDDQEDDNKHQETEDECLSREQEERLAALGVTGTAKPVKASSAELPLGATPSPADTLVTRRVSGDPGWNIYENGRAVEHPVASIEGPLSATKDGRVNMINMSPSSDGAEQQPYHKRTYNEASEDTTDMSRRQDIEPKQCKPRLKQPKVAAAYSRRW